MVINFRNLKIVGFRVRYGKRRFKNGQKRLHHHINDNENRVAKFSFGPKVEKGWIYTEISFFVQPTGKMSEETIYWNVTNVNDGAPSVISGEEVIFYEIKPDIR